MKNLEKFVPLVLFVAVGLKGLIYSYSWVDMGILAILGAISAYYEFKVQNEQIQKMNKRCDAIDEHLTSLYKTNEELKGYFSGVKLAQAQGRPGSSVGFNR